MINGARLLEPSIYLASIRSKAPRKIPDAVCYRTNIVTIHPLNLVLIIEFMPCKKACKDSTKNVNSADKREKN